MPKIYMDGDKVIFDGEGSMATMIGNIDPNCKRIEIVNWMMHQVAPTPSSVVEQTLKFTILPDEPKI